MAKPDKKDSALLLAQQALDDWLHVHAPEHCHQKDVAESQDRILEAGGTIAYIADVQSEIREALK